ncbi:MAG TPA: primosomal protein N', partial [Stellaceae bacterium]|nr:primosomal protein N' [Stellaceae bacterium]
MPDRHASSGAVGAPAASARAALRLSVLLPLPLAGVYDYLAPRASLPAPGEFVIVPLGNRQLLGVAWGEPTGEVSVAKLKTVIERLPAPPMRDELRRLIDWVASYTLAPPGAVLRMAMSVPDALEPARMLVGYALSERGRAALAQSPESLTPTRRRVLEALVEGPPAPAADLARRAGCGA